MSAAVAYQPTETAAALFRDHIGAVFELKTPPGASHKLKFGLPFEMQTQPKDLCEANMEIVRQFGVAFPACRVFHLSLNNSLASTLRALPTLKAATPFAELTARDAIKEVAVGSTLQLLAAVEFLRITLQGEMREAGGEQLRNLVVFEGLNPLLSLASKEARDHVVAAVVRLCELHVVLGAWVSASKSDGTLSKAFSEKLVYLSPLDAYV